MATGEFEGKSLAALHAMVANADPGLLTSRGQALGKAGSDMDGIGGELRAYVDRVEWEGEGGDAFREWGQQFALEAMRFGAYVRTLGHHMVNAGQALTETKAAIPKPEEMCYADPEKDEARKEGEEGKRQEAINQLNRLSSYYRTTGESIQAAEEPDFKPLPGQDERDPGAGASSVAPNSGSRESAAYREPSADFARTVSSGSGAEVRPAPVADRHTPVLDRPVNTTIDSAAPLPVGETRLQTAGPAPSQPSTGPPAQAVPPTAPTGPVHRVDRVYPRTPTTGRPPVGGGGSVTPRSPSGNGITGGTPRQTDSPAAGPGFPRGTVTGGDRAPVGRPVGGHPVGTGGGTPANSGTHPGRPMASQPGGTVGTPRAGSGHGRRDFTPGGTGLVRGGTTSGTAARPTSTNPPPEDRRRGHDRPDHLAEDEETWAAGQRNVVPPVID